MTSFNDICIGNIFRSKPIIGGKNRLFCSLRFIKQILLRESRGIELKLEKLKRYAKKGWFMPIWAGLSPVFPNRFGVSRVKELVNLTSDHTIVHNVYVDYDNQSTHSKLHRPSFICNDVINDVIKRREIRRPPERKELSPQVLKHRQRWLARINRIHRPFLTDRRPLR